MSCPNCDHTMHRLTDDLFWCPRCGSLKDDCDYETPFLVRHIRTADLLPGLDGSVSVALRQWKNIDEAAGFKVHFTNDRRE